MKTTNITRYTVCTLYGMSYAHAVSMITPCTVLCTYLLNFSEPEVAASPGSTSTSGFSVDFSDHEPLGRSRVRRRDSREDRREKKQRRR